MSKSKIWTLPALLDRIWMLSRGKRTAVETTELRTSGPLAGTGGRVAHRVVTAYDEDYKDRTYHLNKIGAPVAAALYERIKTMRAKEAADRKLRKAEQEALKVPALSPWEVAQQIPQMAAEEQWYRQQHEGMTEQAKRDFWKGDHGL